MTTRVHARTRWVDAHPARPWRGWSRYWEAGSRLVSVRPLPSADLAALEAYVAVVLARLQS